jgi:hypothetical protein
LNSIPKIKLVFASLHRLPSHALQGHHVCVLMPRRLTPATTVVCHQMFIILFREKTGRTATSYIKRRIRAGNEKGLPSGSPSIDTHVSTS